MSLEVIEIRDLRDYTKSFVTDVMARDLPGATIIAFDLQYGWNMAIGDGRSGSKFTHSVYNFMRDETIFNTRVFKRSPGGTIVLREGFYSRDALCRNPSVGWYKDGDFTFGGGSTYASQARFKVGQPNLQTGEQKVYTYNAALGGHAELDPVSGNIVASLIWPNIPNDFTGSTSGADVTMDSAGEWRVQLTGTPDQRVFNPLIFEGITSTAGWAETSNPAAGILRGGTSHPDGIALLHTDGVNFLGTGGNVGKRWIWVDLNTGLAIGVLGIPTRTDSSSTGTFVEPSIDGREFEWRIPQFVPDPGSTFAQPKGELHISTSLSSSFVLTGRSIVAPEQTFTADVTRNYVTVYDFNPFNVSGGTIRVHNRRRFLGVVDVPQNPIIAGGFNATDAGDAQHERCVGMIYHPPSRTYIVVAGHPSTATANGADDPAVGHSRIIRFRRAVVVGKVSKPTPTTEVNENRTIKLRVLVSTDLGDQAPGVTVGFSYYRLSTRAETFNGTTQGSTPYVVAAAKIDDDGHLEVRSGGSVDAGGTVLTTPGQYTINFATGTLTPVGSWPSASIFVRYRHRTVRLTPGHGTLLSSSSICDSNGMAFALVRYGDNLDGELDGLEATA